MSVECPNTIIECMQYINTLLCDYKFFQTEAMITQNYMIPLDGVGACQLLMNKIKDKKLKEQLTIKPFAYKHLGFYTEHTFEYKNKAYNAVRFTYHKSESAKDNIVFIVFFKKSENHAEFKNSIFVSSWYHLHNIPLFKYKGDAWRFIVNENSNMDYFFKTLIDDKVKKMPLKKAFDYIDNYLSINAIKYYRELTYLININHDKELLLLFYLWSTAQDNDVIAKILEKIFSMNAKEQKIPETLKGCEIDSLIYSDLIHKELLANKSFQSYIDCIYKKNRIFNYNRENAMNNDMSVSYIISTFFKTCYLNLLNSFQIMDAVFSYLLFNENNENFEKLVVVKELPNTKDNCYEIKLRPRFAYHEGMQPKSCHYITICMDEDIRLQTVFDKTNVYSTFILGGYTQEKGKMEPQRYIYNHPIRNQHFSENVFQYSYERLFVEMESPFIFKDGYIILFDLLFNDTVSKFIDFVCFDKDIDSNTNEKLIELKDMFDENKFNNGFVINCQKDDEDCFLAYSYIEDIVNHPSFGRFVFECNEYMLHNLRKVPFHIIK